MDFWFEFGTTNTYPAAILIESLEAERVVTVSWRAFLQGPNCLEQGWNDSPFNLYPSKGRYMWRDLERICKAQGIPFRRPSGFPRNGLLAARVACCFADAPLLPGFVRAVYRANFEQDLDISTPATVGQCLAASGEDSAAILEEAQRSESKARLRAQTQEAAAHGIFGAPSFRVESELFWGNDRLEDALAWSREHGA